jgi:Helix-turn-helix domain
MSIAREVAGARTLHDECAKDAKQELRPFFTPKSLAEYLSVSERTVRDMLSKGRIPSYKVEATAQEPSMRVHSSSFAAVWLSWRMFGVPKGRSNRRRLLQTARLGARMRRGSVGGLPTGGGHAGPPISGHVCYGLAAI